MTEKEINELCKLATFGEDPEANKAMEQLRSVDPTYHWCWDWDGLVICSTDKEASCCTCFK